MNSLFLSPWILLLNWDVAVKSVVFGGAVRESFWSKARMGPGEYFIVDYIGEPWTSRSVVDCVIRCSQLVAGCECFMFDEAVGLCTPGGLMVKYVDVGVPPPIHPIYISDQTVVCDTTLGFAVFSKNGVSVCAFVSVESVSYDQAEDDCYEKGGLLYMMKSMDKLLIAQEHLNIHEFVWIGLRSNNHNYYWADEELFSPATDVWSKLWKNGEPTNHSPESCCAADPIDSKLHELYCAPSRQYICEVVLN